MNYPRTLSMATLALAACLAHAQSVSKNDTEFLTKAAAGGMYEVEAGKLAESKATDPQVKAFGAMLVKDHTAANEELKALAARKNVSLPTAVDDKHRKKLDKLSRDKSFDKEFVDEVGMDDHKTDIALFEKASKSADDAEIKAFASKTLPALKMHREHAQGLKKSIK